MSTAAGSGSGPAARVAVRVIVPAAGRGRRFGAGAPKQYRSLEGRPVLWHTLRCFEVCAGVDDIVVAIHPDDEVHYAAVVEAGGLTKVRAPVHGGAERADSVAAALQALGAGDDDIVLVHDAVRPWVPAAVVERVIAAARTHGAAVPAVPVTETVKVVGAGGIVTHTPPRSELFSAQTPQGFRCGILRAAYAAAGPAAAAATDEASLVEAAATGATGVAVHVVEGDTTNVKITNPEDLPASGAAGGTGETRVGTGYDVHAFAEGRPLILGGVPIEADRGLAGHSDADVLTHAVIDALLGAAGLGDIGRLFPDDDAAYENISSLVLLERVRERLGAAGAAVVNVDAVVMAQAPKLAGHVPAMERALAGALEIEPARVSVKATTTERLGFVGRQEGMAAQAVALLRL